MWPLGARILIPARCAGLLRAISSSTPMSERILDACGLRYSPQILSRGNFARSRTRTSTPSRASAQAVAAPAGPPPTTMISASRCWPTLANRARDALEQSHVLPVWPRQMKHRCRAREVWKNHRSGVGREHESRMIGREPLESRDRSVEPELARKVKRRIEQRAVGRDYALRDRDAVQRRAGVDAEPHRQIDRVVPLQPPLREGESLLQGRGRLSWSANQKNPERLDTMLLDPLGDLSHFGCVEALLEFFENRIAGALGGYPERAKACGLHRAQQLG